MSGISFGEHSKKILRFGLKLMYKHLKLDMKEMTENLEHYPNPVIKNLNSILVIGANQVKPSWQRNMIKKFGQLALWLIAKDTGYRDMFFWTLNEILKKATELQALIKPYVKPPEEWIPNIWFDSQNKTKQLRKEGKIPDYELSAEEKMYVRERDKQPRRNR